MTEIIWATSVSVGGK